MKRLLLTIALISIPTHAGDIRFPTRTESVDVVPAPASVEVAVDTLEADQWYIVDSDKPLIVLASPGGIVGVESLTGPMTFRGKFPGSTKFETRTFAGPHLFAVTAEAAGKAELIVVPVGATSADDVIRKVLTVSGLGPNPPPKPEPDPGPLPEPTAKNVRVAFVEDATNRPSDVAILLNAVVGWNEFLDAGNEYRTYDLQTTEPRGQRAVSDSQSKPGIVVYDKETDAKIHAGELPKTFGELKSLVRRLTGG